MNGLNFLYLQGVKFDRCVAAEHTDHDFDLALLVVDFGDRTIEALEWTVGDRDHFALAEVDVMLWIFDAHALLDLGDFAVRNWSRFRAATYEAGDTWGVADDVPGFVGELHFDQYVALEDFTLDDLALAVLDLDLLLFWYHSVKDLVGHVDGVDTLTDAVSYFFFVAAVGVDCVPLTGAVVTILCHMCDVPLLQNELKQIFKQDVEE